MTLQPETLLTIMMATLNETNEELVQRVIQVIGVERTYEFFLRTLTIEAGDGLVIANGKRRRTPGGVFFHLVREEASKKERKAIFPPDPSRMGAPAPQEFTWDEVHDFLDTLLVAPKGRMTGLTLRLIGRPKRVARMDEYIVCEMDGDPAPSTALARGMPTPPPDAPQKIAVFISNRQWARVFDKLVDYEEIEMIVDGWPYFNQGHKLASLFASNVTLRDPNPNAPPELIYRYPTECESVPTP